MYRFTTRIVVDMKFRYIEFKLSYCFDLSVHIYNGSRRKYVMSRYLYLFFLSNIVITFYEIKPPDLQENSMKELLHTNPSTVITMHQLYHIRVSGKKFY